MTDRRKSRTSVRRTQSIRPYWASTKTWSLCERWDEHLRCVPKNDTDVTHYRFNPHQPISVIFGRDVAERVCLGKHEPGNNVFSVRHRHASSPGECGWLWTEPVSCKCSKWRPLAFPHARSHPHSPGEDTCLWRTEKTFGTKYIELSLPVRKCPYIATPFSDWRQLVAFRRYSRSSREVVRNSAEIWRFGPPNCGGRNHRNFWPNFINLGHHRTCGKVWWRSAERPRRLGCKKD